MASTEIFQAFNDKALNIAERAAVSASLTEIKLNENFQNTRFWGKILGINRDYLIAVASKVTHKVEHKYFFSQDGGLTFSQLPIVEPWMEPKCMRIAQRFTGTPSYVYNDPKSKNTKNNGNEDDNEENEENTEDNENNGDANNEEEKTDDINVQTFNFPDWRDVKLTSKDLPPPIVHKLTELDRLAWTVNKIDSECLIVPKGSLMLTSKKIMQKNAQFTGLGRSDACKLSSYLHFRTPIDEYAISKYRKITASNDTDFLDGLSMDLPNGCWVLRKEQNGLFIKIKNLLWPGFEFHYNTGTINFNQAYFGYGIRQNDLVFII